MLTHRPMRPIDLTHLCSFAQNSEELFFFFPKAVYPLTTEQLKEAISQRTHSTAIEYNGSLAAFANFYYAQEGGVCKVGNVIVNPKLRNKGIAHYLMQTMQEKAKHFYNASSIQVSCFNHNTAGLLLYNRLGFSAFEVEQRLDKEGNKVALIHFRLVIE